VAEVLVEYPDPIQSEEGTTYLARACAVQVSANSWHGWVEFEPVDGGAPARTPRETTQPNRADAHYWATGLTNVYLEGALRRALNPLLRKPAAPVREPLFDGPAPEMMSEPPGGDAILNPFSIYLKGEALLRRQLAALSAWHLVNIVRAYRIPVEGRDPNRMAAPELIEAIAAAARRRAEPSMAE
jgi:hypothetical protein